MSVDTDDVTEKAKYLEQEFYVSGPLSSCYARRDYDPNMKGYYQWPDRSRIYPMYDDPQNRWRGTWGDGTPMRGDAQGGEAISVFDTPVLAAKALADGGEGPASVRGWLEKYGTQPDPDRREMVREGELMQLKLHHKWHDGRLGYCFARIEAVLDRRRRVRAEITWLDDAEQQTDGIARVYWAPTLTFETNVYDDCGAWRRFDAKTIPLTWSKVIELVAADPAGLRTAYFGEIAQLKVASDVTA